MSVWTEQVDSSLIVQRLTELGAAIDRALKWKDIDTPAEEGIERIRTVLTVIGKRVALLDSSLLRPGSLAPIAGNLHAATENLSNYASDGAAAHLEAAHAQIDSVLASFAGLIIPMATADLEGLRQAADAYRETMSAQLRKLAAETADQVKMNSGFATLHNKREAEVEKSRAELEGALNAFKTETAAAQAQLATTYQGAEQRLEGGVNAKLAEWQAQYDSKEAERRDAHKANLATQAAEATALTKRHEDIFKATDTTWDQKLADLAKKYEADEATLRTEYEGAAAAALESVQGNLRRVQELVGTIGDHGVTAGFKREADDARSEVIYWQRITFWSMFFLILVGVATAFHAFESTPTWISLASRLYLSIATGVLAAYAASQASRYQQRERRNRKLELELRALGPFLEPVEPTEREKFRLKIAEVFFGKDDGITDKPGPATPLQLSKESLEKVIDLAAKAVDKFPSK